MSDTDNGYVNRTIYVKYFGKNPLCKDMLCYQTVTCYCSKIYYDLYVYPTT
jgi:hypothetical protein